MTTGGTKRYSAEEYLDLGRGAEVESECVGGDAFAVSGAIERHVAIVGNLLAALRWGLTGRCRVYSSDMRVRVERTGFYTYPDVVVVRGERRFAGDRRDTLLNPTLIIEVLSESTRGYDRGRNFERCRQLESLVEYVTVAQERPRVERRTRRAADLWLFEEKSRVEDSVTIPSIDCELALADVYNGIDFDAPEERAGDREL
jgi:Uma2 family endonuclease